MSEYNVPNIPRTLPGGYRNTFPEAIEAAREASHMVGLRYTVRRIGMEFAYAVWTFTPLDPPRGSHIIAV